jgi:chaperonin GroES
MKIRPLADKVLLKRLEAEAVTAGGIVLPDTAKEKSSRAEVVSVGPGKLNDDGSRTEMQVKPGDVVLFESYAPRDVKVDGEEFMIIDESSIIAVVEK